VETVLIDKASLISACV